MGLKEPRCQYWEYVNHKKARTCGLITNYDNITSLPGKVVTFLEQREVANLSTSKICENLNFSTEIQIFANFAG